MTDERFNKICDNRKWANWCDVFLKQIDNEAQMRVHFAQVSEDGYIRGNEKEIFCPDWLRRAIFEAVDAHKTELDEEYKEL